MSAEATFWAWRQQGISSTAKLVLLCLADCHNADTGRCDPGAKYIAEKSELNLKTIPVALRRLEEVGLVTVEKRPGTSPNYRLNISQNWDNPKTGIPKNGVTQIRKEGNPNLGEGVTPKTGHKPITKPTSKPTKNKKEIYALDVSALPTEINIDSWIEWFDCRKAANKKITVLAAKKQIEFLTRYDKATQKRIIDTSIANDYQGLFPPKGASHGANQQRPGPISEVDRVSAAISRRAREREAEEAVPGWRGASDG
jgi:hypothetical protein